VTESNHPESLRGAYELELSELGASHPELSEVDAGPRSAPPSAFGRRFPDRFVRFPDPDPTMLVAAAETAARGRTVFATTYSPYAVADSFRVIRESVCAPLASVKIVATPGGVPSDGPSGPYRTIEDIGLMRGLPAMTVVVPADAPSTRAATRALAGSAGPAYLRLSREDRPTVTDGTFHLGHASVLREGTDLTIVAVGALVARALEVAAELGLVGVSVRVLDFASVKPFDEKAVLRAARETGAILTMEEHSVLTGIGSLVASATSEEAPVPVRRIGVPDVFGASVDLATLLDRYGMSKERCLEDAWSLLRARGKVQ
jgi:transketolase